MTTDAQFWNKIARRYAANPVKDMSSYEQTLERAGSYLHADDSVLELGCGTATTALLLAPQVTQYTATDIADEMIAIGREKAVNQGASNVELVTATSDDARFSDGSRDAVLAFNLFHLVDDMDATLDMAHAALKPGGCLISKTVCLGEASFFVPLMVRAMQMVGKAPFVRFFKIAELEQMIIAKGFDIIETGCYPAKPPSRFIVSRKR